MQNCGTRDTTELFLRQISTESSAFSAEEDPDFDYLPPIFEVDYVDNEDTIDDGFTKGKISFKNFHENYEEFDTVRHKCWIPNEPIYIKIIKCEHHRYSPSALLSPNLYTIRITHGQFQWTVRRRYKHFQNLHKQLMLYRAKLSLPVPTKQHRVKRQSFRADRKSLKFPRTPDRFIAEEDLEKRKKDLQTYVQKVVECKWYREHIETLKFLEVSHFSFIKALGGKYKEGVINKCAGGRRISIGCCGCLKKYHFAGIWVKRWMIIKDSFIAYMRPRDGIIRDVLLLDPHFKVQCGFDETGAHHGLLISNSCRELLIKCWTYRQAREWRDSVLQAAEKGGKVYTQTNRFDSYLPVRKDSYARWFIDGASYFEAVAEALDSAKQEIFIADWWLSPEIYLKRPITEGEKWRLDMVLKRKADEGVKIFVLLYKEVEFALGIKSAYSKLNLVRGNPKNIKVLRYPDHTPSGTYLWAHHEKVVVVDQKVAFLGGFDLCYGRWDDELHQLIDIGSVAATQDSTLKVDKEGNRIIKTGSSTFYADSVDQPSQEEISLPKNVSQEYEPVFDESSDNPKIVISLDEEDDYEPRIEPKASQYVEVHKTMPQKTDDRNDYHSQAEAVICDSPRMDSDKIVMKNVNRSGVSNGNKVASGGSENQSDSKRSNEPSSSILGTGNQSANRKISWVESSHFHDTIEGHVNSNESIPLHCDAVVVERTQTLEESPVIIKKNKTCDSNSNELDEIKPLINTDVHCDKLENSSTAESYAKSKKSGENAKDKSKTTNYERKCRSDITTKVTETDPLLDGNERRTQSAFESNKDTPDGKHLGHLQSIFKRLRSHDSNEDKNEEPPDHSKTTRSRWRMVMNVQKLETAIKESQEAVKMDSMPGLIRPRDNKPRQIRTRAFRDSVLNFSFEDKTSRDEPDGFPEDEPDGFPDLLPPNFQHRLPSEQTFEELGVEGSSKLWIGKDYVNFIVKDFVNLDDPFSDFIDRSVTPRMPWHDIGAVVYGETARDVSRHFIQRWNFTKIAKNRNNRNYPILIPKTYKKFSVPRFIKDVTFNVETQIVRSACGWSAGMGHVESSIQSAYVHLIDTAKHYIYIENQFFITQVNDEKSNIMNGIGDALFERIVRAHSNGERFRVYVLLPLLPGFEGEFGTSGATALQAVTHWIFNSISRGGHSLMEQLQKEIPDPLKYIVFCSLRKHTELYGKLVTELVYIHSKLMIVDDRSVIIGSANINDRSLTGKRDSEIAVVVRDRETFPVLFDGVECEAGKFACSLRRTLFREHLGLSKDDESINISDPVSHEFYRDIWISRASINSNIYEEVFNCIPNNHIYSIQALHKYKTEPILAETDPEMAKAKLTRTKGNLVLFPLNFLREENMNPISLPTKLWT